MDKWSKLGDSGSKSAGNPDMRNAPADAPLALSRHHKTGREAWDKR